MTTKSVTNATLLEVLAKLEPGEDLDESLRKLLLEKARKSLLKYRLADQGFQKEYGEGFFRVTGLLYLRRAITALFPGRKEKLYPVNDDA